MSIPQTTPSNPHHGLAYQERPSVQINQSLTGIQQLALYNRQQNARQTQLALQEERTMAMLGQTFGIMEEQNNAVQTEYATALRQAQDTLLNLQNAQQALLLENAQLRAQATVLQSQNNQMTTAHQTDMNGANQRIATLEQQLREKKVKY